MRYPVEARLDIPFDYPSVSGRGIAEGVQGLYTIHRTSSWPKTVREVEEICFPNRLHEHFQQRLNAAVLYGGHTQSKLPYHPNEVRDG